MPKAEYIPDDWEAWLNAPKFRYWSERDDAILKEGYRRNAPVRELASRLKRTPQSCWARAKLLGIHEPRRSPVRIWSKDDNLRLLQMWRSGETMGAIARSFGVTRCAISGQISRLRAKGAPFASRVEQSGRRP